MQHISDLDLILLAVNWFFCGYWVRGRFGKA